MNGAPEKKLMSITHPLVDGPPPKYVELQGGKTWRPAVDQPTTCLGAVQSDT